MRVDTCMGLVMVALLTAAAARADTVAELIQSVRNALAMKRADAEIAAAVSAAKLTDRLEDAAIEQLQSEGAGPLAVEQLEWQREDSAGLPDAGSARLFEPPPPMSPEERQRLVERARAAALQYTAGLPDFLCSEHVRRYARDRGKAWNATDTFALDVAYSEKGESYKLLAIDGRPTRKKLKDIGGFQSNGEFGSLLRQIFRPEAAARFQWERWGNLRGRRVAVFAYRIERKNSKYTVIAAQSFFRRYRISTGMIGFVYIDPETAQILRFSAGDDGLPADCPFRSTYSVLDYDFAAIAGERYLLPRRYDMRVSLKQSQRRNLMDFRDYRKFSSEATVTFEK